MRLSNDWPPLIGGWWRSRFIPNRFVLRARQKVTMPSADPLVSIIMRSCNEGWALGQTLSALQAQEYQHWELIVIDSGSTDGSVELIRQAQPQHFIEIAK